jgi:hypothetical protein
MTENERLFIVHIYNFIDRIQLTKETMCKNPQKYSIVLEKQVMLFVERYQMKFIRRLACNKMIYYFPIDNSVIILKLNFKKHEFSAQGLFDVYIQYLEGLKLTKKSQAV